MSFDVVFCEIEAKILELQMRLLIEQHSICEDEQERRKIESEMKDVDRQLTRCYKAISYQQWDEALRKALDAKKKPPLETDET